MESNQMINPNALKQSFPDQGLFMDSLDKVFNMMYPSMKYKLAMITKIVRKDHSPIRVHYLKYIRENFKP